MRWSPRCGEWPRGGLPARVRRRECIALPWPIPDKAAQLNRYESLPPDGERLLGRPLTQLRTYVQANKAAFV
jgi:hypothetical protein